MNSSVLASTPSSLIQFSDWYRDIHGWLSTVVCIFGIPCNLLNILVLTRPNMISSPTNLILTALAFSDLFTMMSSLPNSVYFYLIHDPNVQESYERDSFFWISYQMLHVAVSVTTHCISIWLTVYLAFFRYIFLLTATPSNQSKANNANKTNNIKSKTSLESSKTHLFVRIRKRVVNAFQNCLKKCRTYNFTVISIVSIALFCVLFCVPSYLYPAIREKDYFDSMTNLTHKIYHINRSNLEIASDGKVYQIMFYSQAIFAKFIPCFLLVTFTSLLISSLIVINKNNKKLNTSYGARANHHHQSQVGKSSETLRLKAKRLKKYLSFRKEENDQLVTTTESTNKQIKPVLNGHKNNHFLTKFLNKTAQNDLNKKYLNEDNTAEPNTKTNEFSFVNESNQIESNLAGPRSPTTPSSLNLGCSNNNVRPVNCKKPKQIKSSKAKENLRTTLMLVIVCVLFLITEFPQSILLFLSIVIDNFYYEVYMPLGDIMDIFALINNSINFVLYCIMSRAFRNTFYSIVSQYCCCLSKLLDTSEQQPQTNSTHRKKSDQILGNQPNTNNKIKVIKDGTSPKKVNLEITLSEKSNQMYSSIELKPIIN